ncbi:hypothetical protein BLNAU_46 [Blattamonas nauphoetae]|uniref:Uncharacterized protein n=1 Tax=Blattamonas nauphoetae TaxID=2049346 RepID=A0ABQ9YM47_9EUKA|nr:hypothetical protein BLNAU_46 [Blattamonas nauphoetae]
MSGNLIDSITFATPIIQFSFCQNCLVVLLANFLYVYELPIIGISTTAIPGVLSTSFSTELIAFSGKIISNTSDPSSHPANDEISSIQRGTITIITNIQALILYYQEITDPTESTESKSDKSTQPPLVPEVYTSFAHNAQKWKIDTKTINIATEHVLGLAFSQNPQTLAIAFSNISECYLYDISTNRTSKITLNKPLSHLCLPTIYFVSDPELLILDRHEESIEVFVASHTHKIDAKWSQSKKLSIKPNSPTPTFWSAFVNKYLLVVFEDGSMHQYPFNPKDSSLNKTPATISLFQV